MDELDRIVKLAGIHERRGESSGANMSITASEKARLMKKHKIKPGTPAWFKLWFSKPYLTGERPI